MWTGIVSTTTSSLFTVVAGPRNHFRHVNRFKVEQTFAGWRYAIVAFRQDCLMKIKGCSENPIVKFWGQIIKDKD